MDQAQLLAIFTSILPAERILTSRSDLDFYGKDASKDFSPAPGLILLPATTQEVQAVVRAANQHGVSLVPSGGRTGYSGGATAEKGEVVVSLSRMNRILEVNTFDQTIRCEAGVTTEAIQNKAKEVGLFYPVDFSSSGSSQIGGNVATNAGGIRVIRYGNTRDWVLGLEVVTGNGEHLSLNGALFKNNTGYDLRGLLIGSEGTLGVITEVTLKLSSPPKSSTTALCGLPSLENVVETLKSLRSDGFAVNVFEYFDPRSLELVMKHHGLRNPLQEDYESYVLVDVETATKSERERFEGSLGGLIEKGVVSDAVFGEGEKKARELFRYRELISETIGRQGVPHKNDLCVPVSSIPAFIRELKELFLLEYPGFEVVIFGHVGDGNLHVNILKPPKMDAAEFFSHAKRSDIGTFTLIQKFHGSISAEHGVGLLKKPFLNFSRSGEEIRIMKDIKRAFDPKGILNPGKIFD